MLMRRAARPARHIGAEEAAALVRPGMWIDYAAVLAGPDAFDRALAARKEALHGVNIRSCIAARPRAVIECDPEGRHFNWISLHFGGYDRRKHDLGLAHYMPVNLGEIPDYYRRFIDPVDIAVIKVAPMDGEGMFNFGLANLWHRAVIERARCVIVEVSPAVPRAVGVDNGIHVSEVDYIIDSDPLPLPELPNPPPTEVDRAVAARILEEIGDGACLQIGIGGMPNAVCTLLRDANVRDIGIHTEMLTDGIAALYRAGLVTGARKQMDPGRIVYSFGFGSQSLYDTVDGNPDFLCCPVDYTNLPHSIMRNDNVVAINNTTQIDLQGQAASESDGHRHISGTGGQLQFVRGAYASKGGKSFICLASTYERKGERRSRIVTALTRGNIVTTPRTDMMYVVTEYGIANLKGRSVPERARLLIGLAHPDFREELEREAHAARLLPRAVF
ncbi:MAG: butyryl-CoA:acetate CoA-transferase [Rhodobacteraceae bacterium]|nr:butyryl-CoA:acetate CoA-transferase [Paracoccaceae bacterium]